MIKRLVINTPTKYIEYSGSTTDNHNIFLIPISGLTTTTTTETPPPVAYTTRTFALGARYCHPENYPSTFVLVDPADFGAAYFDPDQLNTNIEWVDILTVLNDDSDIYPIQDGVELTGGERLTVNVSGEFDNGDMGLRCLSETSIVTRTSTITLQIKLRDNSSPTQIITLYYKQRPCTEENTTTTTTMI